MRTLRKYHEDTSQQEDIGWLQILGREYYHLPLSYNWRSSPCPTHMKRKQRAAHTWTETWLNGQGCSRGTPEGQSARHMRTGSHNHWGSQTSSGSYLSSIEARATFMSFIGPILAYLTPKVLFLGSLCSVAICFCTGAMSIHGAYKYVQQSRVAKVTVSAMTILKLLCCAPAAFLTDDKFLRNQQAIADKQLIIANIKRDERRRKRATVESATEPGEPIYEEFNPYAKCKVIGRKDPSAPGVPADTKGNTTSSNDAPFVYPTILPTSNLADILNNSLTDNLPAYLQPEYSTQ